MAETETLGRVEPSEEASPSQEASVDTVISVRVMRSPDTGTPLRRVFYFTVMLLALWIALTLVVLAVGDWI